MELRVFDSAASAWSLGRGMELTCRALMARATQSSLPTLPKALPPGELSLSKKSYWNRSYLFWLLGNWSRRPLSRVESGGKPPGEIEKAISPGPPLTPVRSRERLYPGAALVEKGCLNFR